MSARASSGVSPASSRLDFIASAWVVMCFQIASVFAIVSVSFPCVGGVWVSGAAPSFRFPYASIIPHFMYCIQVALGWVCDI